MATNEEIVYQIQHGINPADNLEQLYIQNERFIHMIARRYARNKDNIDDLIQEGYLGLYEAVNRYEDTAGVLFMTYAGFWIRQAMTNYLKNNGRIIRVSAWMHSKIIEYKKIVSAFEAAKGREPSDDELCYCMRINQTTLNNIRQACQIDNIQSLDAAIVGNEDYTIRDTIQDETVNVADDVIDSIMEKSRRSELWKIVRDNLNPRENEVIHLKYKKNMTLAAVGRECNISRERARVIERQALRKLRRAKIRRVLSEKFEGNYARIYHGGIGDFHNRRDSSIVEDIAIRSVELEGAANV